MKLQGRSRRRVVKLFCTTASGHCCSLCHTRTSTRTHTHAAFPRREGPQSSPLRDTQKRARRQAALRRCRRGQVQIRGRPVAFTTASSGPPGGRPRGLVRPRHLGQLRRPAACPSRLSRRLLAAGCPPSLGTAPTHMQETNKQTKAKLLRPRAQPGLTRRARGEWDTGRSSQQQSGQGGASTEGDL